MLRREDPAEEQQWPDEVESAESISWWRRDTERTVSRRSAAGGFAVAGGGSPVSRALGAYLGYPLVGHTQQSGNVPYR
jgi:hypothetical protein